MNKSSGDRRRDSFDEVAELYDRARPGYPQRLINDLVDLTGPHRGQRILEIGSGTGQLKVPLAELGVDLVAVELGSKLAGVARRNLARFKHAEVVVADFDEWPLPGTPFDLVVTGTAFHWLDPDTRIRKCADASLPGGTLAIVDTRWGIGRGDDPFFTASQPCWARWDPAHDPDFQAPRPEDLPEQRDDLSSSGLFAQITLRRYVCAREYSAARYCDLPGTFSNVLVLDEPSRTGLLGCIADLIQSRFGGTVVRHDLYDLWLARKKRPEDKY